MGSQRIHSFQRTLITRYQPVECTVVELYEVNRAQTGTVVASDMAATIICDCYNIMTRLDTYRIPFKLAVYLGHVPQCFNQLTEMLFI